MLSLKYQIHNIILYIVFTSGVQRDKDADNLVNMCMIQQVEKKRFCPKRTSETVFEFNHFKKEKGLEGMKMLSCLLVIMVQNNNIKTSNVQW